MREYTVFSPKYLAAVVPAVLIGRNFAVVTSVYSIEEGLKSVVYSLGVKLSSRLLQVRPADRTSPQLRIQWLDCQTGEALDGGLNPGIV
jgi:hypothetical protein